MQPLDDSQKSDDHKKILQAAKRCLKIESEAVADLAKRLNNDFAEVVKRLHSCKGHLVVTGIGKSGLIGQKIAATFSSIGLPSIFLHAAEAIHGDLGIVSDDDIILAISNSGETEEIVKLLPAINRFKCTLVAMTGNPVSTLARRAQYVLDISTREEACTINMVPTASTTATLAMGDAMALGLMELRGFRPEDFAVNHPGGSLGRKLFTTVDDLMHTDDDIPSIPESADIYAVLTEMSRKRLGVTLVVDDSDRLQGIITDGDLRRLMESKKDYSAIQAGELMSGKPKTVPRDAMATKALQIMEEFSITTLIVSNDGESVDGIVHLHDLLKAGIA